MKKRVDGKVALLAVDHEGYLAHLTISPYSLIPRHMLKSTNGMLGFSQTGYSDTTTFFCTLFSDFLSYRFNWSKN